MRPTVRQARGQGAARRSQEALMSDAKHPSHPKPHLHSLNQAVGAYATRKLAASKPADLVAQFRQQGIGSLEDLAAAIVEQANGAVRGTLADPEYYPVCYKFTTAKPNLGDISQVELQQFTQFVEKQEIG
jgi:hypothetical protein